MHTTDLYFEAHITIEPVEDDTQLQKMLRGSPFRLAELYMKKGGKSTLDSFMTARGTDFKSLELETIGLVNALIMLGYQVYRYKIENTLVDVRFNDNVQEA